MKYRLLGSTGLKVSEIGFGTWGIGGLTKGATSYGPTDDRESIRALNRAFDLGINFFDTSNIYGENGHSEKLLGKTFAQKRDKVIFASKAGFIYHEKPTDFSPAVLRKSLEGSLKRLKTDFLDLFQLHSPPMDIFKKNPEIIQCLKELQREGKIRAFGVSVKNPDDALTAVMHYGFEYIQVNFNMIDQRIVENGFVNLAERKKIGVIARTPLCFGFLTGKREISSLDPCDHRTTWPTRQLEIWSKAASFFEELAGAEKSTPAQLALRFCLSFGSISTVIPGMLTAMQVEENQKASPLGRLSQSSLEEIKRIYLKNTFFVKSNTLNIFSSLW